MLIAVERLMIKLRQPASRATELIELRRRLRAELASDPDDDERVLASAILDQKCVVSSMLRAVASCSSCASGHALPNGRYDGGDCCAGVTATLFDETELAALAHAGTRPHHLVAPRTDHAGCAFRGSVGCTLELPHRPARCVHYVCTTLRREIHDRGALDALEGALAELDRRVQRFGAVHAARVDTQVLAPLIDALAAARARITTGDRRSS